MTSGPATSLYEAALDPTYDTVHESPETSDISSATVRAAQRRSAQLERAITTDPKGFRVLTGDRPTGPLHIGHLLGSLHNRVRLQDAGVDVVVVIADYQVITDRDVARDIGRNVHELLLDYLAVGIDPERSLIFAHSAVPALNQLLLPFLSLVTVAELERNPTVKDEARAARRRAVGTRRAGAGSGGPGRELGGAGVHPAGATAAGAGVDATGGTIARTGLGGLLLTYPVHQAADILFCHGTLVPVGRDQLPHVELTRTIARRFNDRYAAGAPVFTEPDALLSSAPAVLGTDGTKMSKSRGNAIALGADEDTTAALIRKTRTDAERTIAYDPAHRPEVASLLTIAAFCRSTSPETVADEVASGGASRLKAVTTEAVNEYLRPIRRRRRELAAADDHLRDVIRAGNLRASEIAERTLTDVRELMGMTY